MNLIDRLYERGYTYSSGDGIRTSKTVGGVTYNYIYASGKLMRQTWTESGTAHVMDFIYDDKGAPYAMKYDGTNYFYLLNLQGDVIGITSSTGSRYGIYRYDAYGNILYQSSHDILEQNPLRYRGYVFDKETGFYYLQSRYYDPAIGRFINADSLASTGQGFLGYNMFAYCLNNPVNGIDPAGTAMKIAQADLLGLLDHSKLPLTILLLVIFMVLLLVVLQSQQVRRLLLFLEEFRILLDHLISVPACMQNSVPKSYCRYQNLIMAWLNF